MDMEEEREIKNKKIELSFPKLQSQEDNEYLPKGKGVQGGILERFSASIEEVSDGSNSTKSTQ